MSGYYFPNEVWESIKEWLFPVRHWVVFMSKSMQNHSHYISHFLSSDPVTVFNIEYNTPIKRRFFREWLNIPSNLLHPDFPTVGSIVLDYSIYNTHAVNNWWGIYASHMGFSHAQNASVSSNLMSPVTVESALTSDLDKAETWLFYVQRYGIGYIQTHDIYDITKFVYKLVEQMRHGREWEMRMLRMVCLSSTEGIYAQHVYDQIIDSVVRDLLINRQFESIEVMLESGAVNREKIAHTLYSEYITTKNQEITGILRLINPSYEYVHGRYDDEDNDNDNDDISTGVSSSNDIDTEDDDDTLWQHSIPFV